MNRENILIEADKLLEIIDQPNIRIYDATILFYRNEGDPTAYDGYLQGHIPGAAFFDHQDFSDPNNSYEYMVLPENDLAEQIGRIGIDEEAEVIFYTSGVLPCATRAWWVLRYAGHNHVRVLNGGLAAWEKAGGKIEKGARQYQAASYNGRLRPNMFAGKDEVMAAIENGDVCTVNTLNSESYEEAHIVGSTLLSCMDLMLEMAALLPNADLIPRLKPELHYKRVITYCGGGVAATVNGIAHLIAGNENVAVYDGSMNEWVGEGYPTGSGGKE